VSGTEVYMVMMVTFILIAVHQTKEKVEDILKELKRRLPKEGP
jgi:hypothetical protein